MFYGYATSTDVTTLFVKQAHQNEKKKTKQKSSSKPSISIHALWLIYFKKLFFSFFFYQLFDNYQNDKKGQQKNTTK